MNIQKTSKKKIDFKPINTLKMHINMRRLDQKL